MAGGKPYTFHQPASAHVQSAILHFVPVEDSGNFVQDDGIGWVASQARSPEPIDMTKVIPRDMIAVPGNKRSKLTAE